MSSVCSGRCYYNDNIKVLLLEAVLALTVVVGVPRLAPVAAPLLELALETNAVAIGTRRLFLRCMHRTIISLFISLLIKNSYSMAAQGQSKRKGISYCKARITEETESMLYLQQCYLYIPY